MRFKKLSLSVLLTILSVSLFSQVKDIGIDFRKKGFLRDIDYSSKKAIIDFINDGEISTELVSFSDNCSFAFINGTSSVTSLRIGMAAMIEGEFFRKTKVSIVKKVIQTREIGKKITINNGRLDAIVKGFAVVDGKKIKLEGGTKINGKNGYKKNFSALTDLVLGDIVNLKGTYKEDGFVYANKFEVEPEIETKYDEAAKEKLNPILETLYPVWTNKSERKKLFGKKLLGQTITNSEVLQEYVNSVGNRLIPEFLKGSDSKFKFIFIVIDNPDWNACVFANGLSFVNMGLLIDIKNEAQLAAVLGHEISHAIYEHTAKHYEDEVKAEKKGKVFEKGKEVFDGLFGGAKPTIKTNLPNLDNNSSKILLSELPKSFILNKLSDFSVEEEEQADRVGLFLMVNAGYDPREASAVWRNQYNKYPNTPLKSQSYFGNAVDDIQKTKITKKTSIALEVIKSVSLTKMNKNLLDSKKTHPDNLSRYAELNEIIDLYWSQIDLNSLTTKGFDEFLSMWKKVSVETQKK